MRTLKPSLWVVVETVLYIKAAPGLMRISIFYTVQLHHCKLLGCMKTRKEVVIKVFSVSTWNDKISEKEAGQFMSVIGNL